MIMMLTLAFVEFATTRRWLGRARWISVYYNNERALEAVIHVDLVSI